MWLLLKGQLLISDLRNGYLWIFKGKLRKCESKEKQVIPKILVPGTRDDHWMTSMQSIADVINFTKWVWRHQGVKAKSRMWRRHSNYNKESCRQAVSIQIGASITPTETGLEKKCAETKQSFISKNAGHHGA